MKKYFFRILGFVGILLVIATMILISAHEGSEAEGAKLAGSMREDIVVYLWLITYLFSLIISCQLCAGKTIILAERIIYWLLVLPTIAGLLIWYEIFFSEVKPNNAHLILDLYTVLGFYFPPLFSSIFQPLKVGDKKPAY